MCGIFGWKGNVPLELKKEVAILASERGFHSFGYVDNSLKPKKFFGELKKQLNDIDLDCYCLIGHQRLGTIGDLTVNNTAPFSNNEIAFVHNGNIRDYKSLADSFNYTMTTSTDSEVLFPIIKNMAYHLIETPFAIAYINDEDIFLIRQGLPIFVKRTNDYTIFGSKEFSGSNKISELSLYKL